MVMPQAGRIAAAVVGGLLILASVSSVSGTLIVTRLVQSRLTRWIDRGVDWGYHLATARPAASHPGGRHLADPAGGMARRGLRGVRLAAVAVRRPRRGLGLHRRRVLAVHPGLRRTRRGGAGGDRVPGRGGRPADHHTPDRLPADPVRGVQPPGNRGGAAERAGRGSVLGPGIAGAHALRAGIGHLNPGYDAGSVRRLGTLGRRRHREPYHLPAARPVPLPYAAVVMGDRAAGH